MAPHTPQAPRPTPAKQEARPHESARLQQIENDAPDEAKAETPGPQPQGEPEQKEEKPPPATLF